MSEKAGIEFRQSIVENPDDDMIRLAYADWLEERGDVERAEFIRIQIERTNLDPWDARQLLLLAREHVLLEHNVVRWKRELPKLENVAWGVFRRGFVASIAIPSYRVLKSQGDRIWETLPIEGVTVGWPERNDAIEYLEPRPQLKWLHIDSVYVGREDAEWLANAPLLETVETLNVAHCDLGQDGFERLLASPHLGNLRRLYAQENSIGNAAFHALALSSSVKTLYELNLASADSYSRYHEDPSIDDSGIRDLLNWSGFRHLRSLNLAGNKLQGNGLQMLLESEASSALRNLILRDNGLSGRDLAAFQSAPLGMQLDMLDLGENLLTGGGMEGLIGSRCLDELKVLKLDRCELPPDSGTEMAQCPFINSLRILNLNDNNFGANGILGLLSGGPSQLHTLLVANNKLGDKGLSHLVNSSVLKQLLRLDLRRNKLGDESIQKLAMVPDLQLLFLPLKNNNIGRAGEASLIKSPLFQRLMHFEPKDEDDDFTGKS